MQAWSRIRCHLNCVLLIHSYLNWNGIFFRTCVKIERGGRQCIWPLSLGIVRKVLSELSSLLLNPWRESSTSRSKNQLDWNSILWVREISLSLRGGNQTCEPPTNPRHPRHSPAHSFLSAPLAQLRWGDRWSSRRRWFRGVLTLPALRRRFISHHPSCQSNIIAMADQFPAPSNHALMGIVLTNCPSTLFPPNPTQRAVIVSIGPVIFPVHKLTFPSSNKIVTKSSPSKVSSYCCLSIVFISTSNLFQSSPVFVRICDSSAQC